MDQSSEINQYQENLYANLLALCNDCPTKTSKKQTVFYYKDFSFNHAKYRIFSYRLANYSQFMRPDGIECRGHTFQVDKHGKLIRLASLPLEKFFNINENTSTQNLNFENPMQVMRKEDGSLISTFLDINGKLCVKSKASMLADNGDGWHGLKAVYEFLNDNAQKEFYSEMTDLEKKGWTINLEYTAPDNQIVLSYTDSKLTVLAVRSRIDGSYMTDFSEYPEISSRRVEQLHPEDMNEFLNSYADEKNIEGYVVQLSTGKFVKLKTKWYFDLHHARDGALNSNESLFKAVCDENTDDLKAIITCPITLRKIQAYEDLTMQFLNEMIDGIDNFYHEHGDKARKHYHKQAGRLLPDWHMAMTMRRLDREFEIDDYKEFMKGSWRKLRKTYEALKF